MSYSEAYRVAFGDTDAAGVVFYPNYYRWFDRMTHELFRHLGVPLDAFLRQNEGPVLVDTGCTFRQPLHYDNLVTLRAEVAEVGRRSFRIAHSVILSDVLVATGFEVRVWVRVDEEGVTSIPLPNDLRDALERTPTVAP